MDRTCVRCRRRLGPTELQTCPLCVGRTRADLAEVVHSYSLLPVELEGRAGAASPPDASGVRSSGDSILGGDVLTLLAPGSTRPTWPPETEPADSVSGVLGRWEDDWRTLLSLPGARTRATVETCSAFLGRNLSWAAQHHPTFTEFAADLKRLRGALESATRQAEPREPSTVSCPECGGRLVKDWADPDPCPPGCAHVGEGHDQGGRREDWRCADRNCGRVVTAAEYWLALRNLLETDEPNR